jgi:hypothetical protein
MDRPLPHDPAIVVTPRIFTPAEAGDALRELRPVAERMVELRARQREAAARQAELAQALGSNGHGLTVNDLALAEQEVLRLGAEIGDCVQRIDDAGVQVKDLDAGLLDFPSVRDGREILLCWRVGEDEIAFWHGLEEGFAGRKPLGEVE